MNDRSVSLLSNYDVEVLRTWKGRGAILCETKQGILIWKEYVGHKEKIVYQDAMLQVIRERGFPNVESIFRNKEQELLSQDQDGTLYVLKTYFEGRECNVHDMEECRQAIRTLAALHKTANQESSLSGTCFTHSAHREFEKHNRELKKVRRYLKERSQKTDFEIFLMESYDYFFSLALQITEEQKLFQQEEEDSSFCHGDYQYHNIIISGNEMNVINFEKCHQASSVKDLYLFMRKLLEKSNWSESVGFDLTQIYESIRPMEKEEYRQLFYRLAYPEKFWKIVNFYYNSGKAWIPGKNTEKLQKIVEQEANKQQFLKKFSQRYGLDS